MEVHNSSRTTSFGYSWYWVRHRYRLPVGKWMARHVYLGAHRHRHSRRGILFLSGPSAAALAPSPLPPTIHSKGNIPASKVLRALRGAVFYAHQPHTRRME